MTDIGHVVGGFASEDGQLLLNIGFHDNRRAHSNPSSGKTNVLLL